MNRLKILGLLVVAASALMAMVGTGTASATLTSLCEEKETDINGITVCKKENQYPAGTEIHAELESGTNLLIHTPITTIECKKSTISAITEKETEIPLGATVTAFTFAECTNSTVVVIEKGTLDIELIDLPNWTHNGTLEFTKTTIRVTRFGVECRYALGHAGTLTGGAMATIDFNAALTFIGGSALCNGPASMTASYTVTDPEPLWVSM